MLFKVLVVLAVLVLLSLFFFVLAVNDVMEDVDKM